MRLGDRELPLSQYVALDPERVCRRSLPLLLKILDPLPEPIRGDLYLETHDTKHEVYVVTRVDPEAWPDGRGGVRLGVDQALRGTAASDSQFRDSFLAAVCAYERVRRAIDDATAGAEEHASEPELRAAMNRFTSIRRLAVGDVVQVAPGLPHALQHGVRVFEFQTPTYERNIISFAQRVVSQPHWDSEYAITRATLDAAPEPAIEPVQTLPQARVERIAAFSDFEVQRLTVSGHGQIALDWYPDTTPYSMVAACSGEWRLDALTLGAECAAFIPACATTCTLVNQTAETQTALLALPLPHTAGNIDAVDAS
ncbi:MAG: hypothetical protein AAF515_18180 [Pseudomonadota bacterium]